jgi:hypothetical protein
VTRAGTRPHPCKSSSAGYTRTTGASPGEGWPAGARLLYEAPLLFGPPIKGGDAGSSGGPTVVLKSPAAFAGDAHSFRRQPRRAPEQRRAAGVTRTVPLAPAERWLCPEHARSEATDPGVGRAQACVRLGLGTLTNTRDSASSSTSRVAVPSKNGRRGRGADRTAVDDRGEGEIRSPAAGTLAVARRRALLHGCWLPDE